jgi:hypothetical protein
MTNKDLITQYADTGLQLPEYQVSKLPNWAKKTYIRKRFIGMGNGGYNLFDYELLLLPSEQQSEYINRLDSSYFHAFISNGDMDRAFNIIFKYKKKFNDSDVRVLIQLARNKDIMINKIIKLKGGDLTDDNYMVFLNHVTDKESITNIILKDKGSNLSGAIIRALLDNSTDKDQMATVIIKIKGDGLTDANIDDLLDNSTNKDQISNLIIKVKGNDLSYSTIRALLTYSTKPHQISNIIKGSNLTDDKKQALEDYLQKLMKIKGF